MKIQQLLSALLVFISLTINAQTKMSINNTTVSISPSYTVNNGTPITVIGQVKNVGTTTVTANVHVNMAIDTSSTGTPKYFKRSTATTPVVGFAPNAIFNFTVTDVAGNGNGYKIAGNGTTIVVWTVVGLSTDSITALDSVFTNIYVVDLTSIEDWKYSENNNILIQNPASGVLNFKFLGSNNESISVELLNSSGKAIEILNVTGGIQYSTFNIQHLSQGMYYLNFYNKNKNKIGTKKVIIQ